MQPAPTFEKTRKGDAAAFLISLEREATHRIAVFEELKKLHLGPIEVIRAFDGEKRLAFTNSRLKPFLGTFGCLLSHLSIYLHCHRNSVQRALIFEDDAKVTNPQVARRAIHAGESSEVDICCYCSNSTDNQFLNCHAYSISLQAMRASLSRFVSILEFPINIHIDRLIEHCRRTFGFTYRSIRGSTIVQDKTLPFTTRWGAPEYVERSELARLSRLLFSGRLEIATTINSISVETIQSQTSK